MCRMNATMALRTSTCRALGSFRRCCGGRAAELGGVEALQHRLIVAEQRERSLVLIKY